MNRAASGGVRVEVRGLRKRYHGHWVLNGLDFEVEPGEVFAVMGPSGSGKTVLLKHIIGLERPDQGAILIDGMSIDTPDFMEKVRLAMVFQSGALLNSLTVGENVGLYLSEHRLKPQAEIDEIVRRKLELVGLDGQEHRYPAELSGGMKKRVAIARALVIEPQLLLYDEPTSELDPQMAVVIGEEICNMNRRIGATSIVVTHDREMAFGIADRVAVMLEGQLRTIGTPDEVRVSRDPIIAEFLSASFKEIRKAT
jgi:phospholipid/cholesterol/gamma-HCH transport system ATP-binding protein